MPSETEDLGLGVFGFLHLGLQVWSIQLSVLFGDGSLKPQRALEFRVDTPGTLSLNGNKRAAQNAQSVRLSTTPLARATSWSRIRIFPGCVFRCVGAVWRFRDNCLGLGSNEDL